ncbi:acyltransferase family protein [Corynebacterium striatum]|uniref:acyltransferase family protein n=1 Tax=Corynebacterium striatum TaxID=43770 RepID=UPI00254FD903|nr:acyltransferase family protein [Corynebacterium striatum]MDK8825919.1 acyltransferase family protein [Corynebacterium striatum]
MKQFLRSLLGKPSSTAQEKSKKPVYQPVATPTKGEQASQATPPQSGDDAKADVPSDAKSGDKPGQGRSPQQSAKPQPGKAPTPKPAAPKAPADKSAKQSTSAIEGTKNAEKSEKDGSNAAKPADKTTSDQKNASVDHPKQAKHEPTQQNSTKPVVKDTPSAKLPPRPNNNAQKQQPAKDAQQPKTGNSSAGNKQSQNSKAPKPGQPAKKGSTSAATEPVENASKPAAPKAPADKSAKQSTSTIKGTKNAEKSEKDGSNAAKPADKTASDQKNASVDHPKQAKHEPTQQNSTKPVVKDTPSAKLPPRPNNNAQKQQPAKDAQQPKNGNSSAGNKQSQNSKAPKAPADKSSKPSTSTIEGTKNAEKSEKDGSNAAKAAGKNADGKKKPRLIYPPVTKQQVTQTQKASVAPKPQNAQAPKTQQPKTQQSAQPNTGAKPDTSKQSTKPETPKQGASKAGPTAAGAAAAGISATKAKAEAQNPPAKQHPKQPNAGKNKQPEGKPANAAQASQTAQASQPAGKPQAQAQPKAQAPQSQAKQTQPKAQAQQPQKPRPEAEQANRPASAAKPGTTAKAAGAEATANSANHAATEQEIARALARRSQSVGTPSQQQLKAPKPPREAQKHPNRSAQTSDAKPNNKPIAKPTAKEASIAAAPAAFVQPPKNEPRPQQSAKPATPVMVDSFPHEPEALATPPESKEVKHNRRARLRQVKGLDGLRGLAVLAVVIYHFFGDFLPGGYLGVDMFFVLSGFLITSLLVREFRASGRISLKDFWVRRFRRILPAALTVLIICTSIVALVGGDLAVGIREQFLGTFFFVNNWTQIATSQSYFADNEIQVFAHYWSLAVEEQFYVIWPLLIFTIFAISRRQPRRLPIAVSLILAIASGVAMWLIYVPGEDPTRVYYGTDTHAFGLLIGAILSLMLTSTKEDPGADSWASPGKSERVLAGTIGFLALAGYIAQLFLMPDDADFTYRGGLVLTSVLGALMIWGVVREFGPLKWIFSTAVMRWLGQRSFSLYLWHWPVVMILRAIFDGNHSSDKPWILGLVAIPISFLLAELSYQFVENPFRRGGYKKTWTGYWAARPSISEMKDGFAKAFWPFVPLIVVASLVGVGYALATSSDKSELEQQLEMLQQKNTQSNQGNPGAAAAPASPEENTSRPMPTGNEITAIGDSVMLAASEALQQRYPGIYVDADVSRHYTAAIPIIQQLKDSGQLRSTVFLGFGTNGPAFPDQIQEVVDLIGPDHTIVMAVPYGDRGWMAQSQRDVIDAAKKYDNVYLADWCTHAQSNPNLLYSDGIHPLPEGASEYALAFHYALLQYSNYDKNLDSKCQI